MILKESLAVKAKFSNLVLTPNLIRIVCDQFTMIIMKTSLTDLLNITYPILQAPIGSATTPELAAAVSNAGGLGSLALSWKSPDDTREMIRKTKQLTSKPFAVNLVLAFEQDERVQICIEEKVAVVYFFFGDG